MSTATAPTPKPKHAPPRVADQKLFIGGKWVSSVSGKTFETINPSTGEVICRVAEGDKADIDLAVAAARKAFESGPWGRMNPSARGRLINKLADAIEAHKDELLATAYKGKKPEIGRFKGLGEMMPAQLKETTKDPATRTLARISLPDGETTVNDLVETLMGRKPELRFRFIQDNAEFAAADVDV